MTDLQSALDIVVLNELRQSVGDDKEFFAELIDEFLADAPCQLERLREAAATGDAEVARRAAHTLKGNGQTFGAEQLASLCQHAETDAGAGDLASVSAGIGEIDRAWSRVRDELVALRAR